MDSTYSTDPEPVLRSDRLVLEPLVANHADLLYESLRDDALYTFIPDDPPTSASALADRYRWLEVRRSPDGQERWLNWAVRRHAGGDYVGTVQATVLPDGTALIAYVVFTRFQRRGFAFEACQALIAYLEGDLGATTLVAEIDTRNTASIALVERLGFRRVATTSDVDFFKGASSHEHRYERERPGGTGCG